MTFAIDNDEGEEQSLSAKRPIAHATQHATNILNKSFLMDKTVDITAKF